MIQRSSLLAIGACVLAVATLGVVSEPCLAEPQPATQSDQGERFDGDFERWVAWWMQDEPAEPTEHRPAGE